MSTIVSRDVDDLSEASRQGIEQVLGAPLEPHQRVYIVVDTPLPGPSGSAKLAAAGRIRNIISQAQAHADAHHVSDDEIDAAVEEAMSNIGGHP